MKWHLFFLVSVSALWCCKDISGARSFDFDACYYPQAVQAAKVWTFATYPVTISEKVKEKDLSAIVFPCKFPKAGDRCMWQKDFALPTDLSSYPYIYLRMYVENASAIRSVGIYWGVTESGKPNAITGWYRKFFSPQEGWNIFIVKREDLSSEGNVPADGWKRVKTLRLSLWGNSDNSTSEITIKTFRACEVPEKDDVSLIKSEGPLFDESQFRIIPIPQSMEWTKDVFCSGKTDIPVYLTKNESSQRVFDRIQADFPGCTFRPKPSLNDDGLVAVFGDATKLPSGFMADMKKEKKLSAEGYYLDVDKDRIVLVGKDEVGFYYGIQTLRQIWKSTPTGVSVDGVKITDFPSLSMRGLYLHRLGRRIGNNDEALAKTKTIIKGLSSMKINFVFIDVSSDMQYDDGPFPVSNPTPYTKDQWKELVAFARQHYVTLCPYFQMFMHVGWMAAEPQYRHLLEDPNQMDWDTSWCPSNPETYDFAENLIGQAIEVFNPPYVHIAHDEMTVSKLGTCDRCRGKSYESLIAKSMNRLCDFIESKKIKTIVWHDTLHPIKIDSDKICSMVRHSLVVDCWDYDQKKEESLTLINRAKKAKFQDIIISPFLNERNIKIMSEVAKETEIMGAIGTLWHQWGAFGSYPDKISDKALPAIGIDTAYFWNANAPTIAWSRYDWNYRVRCFMEPQRSLDSISEMNFDTVQWSDDIKKSVISNKELQNISLPSSVDVGSLPFRSISPIILSGIKGETEYPVKIQIPINQKAKSLYFLHTLTEPFDRDRWEHHTNCTRKPEVGRYTVVYEDNTKQIIFLKYRWNINSWNSVNGVPDGFVACQGVNEDEKLFRLYGLAWANPSPQKMISHIGFSSAQEDGMNPVLLAISVGSKPLK